MSLIIDYVAGMYTKIRLDDNSIIMLSLESSSIRVVQMIFGGLIPKKQLGRIGGRSLESITENIIQLKNVNEVTRFVSSINPF